jgi:hypothetical protein
MPPNRHAFRATLVIAGAVALSVFWARPAAAAIIGSITPSEAQPGDRVTLMAQGPAGQTQTVYLIGIADFERQIARYGHQVCSTPGQYPIGSITWKGPAGSLAFNVPRVAGGRYYLQVKVRNVSPDCWRIASQGEAVVLTVIARAGGTEVPGPTPLSPLAALLLLGTASLATAAISGLTRRQA